MHSSFKKFSLHLTLYTIGISILTFIVFHFIPKEFYNAEWPYLIVFFYSVTFLVHFVLLKSTEKKFSKFYSSFMLSTTAKLMLYLTVLVVYSLLNKNNAVNFIITFLILYILFTIFEVASAVKLSNKKKN